MLARLKSKGFWREVAILAAMMATILAARSTLADHYHVPSGSMEYTLLPGDRVFVDKRAYGLRIPFTTIDILSGDRVQRGDVVIFDNPDTGIRLIKRIVAIGGDEVNLENGHLQINGQWLAAPNGIDTELFGDKAVLLNLQNGGGQGLRMVVPDGEVLAIGDHRGRSADSRVFGPVDEDLIYGRAVAIYYRSGDGFRWSKL